MSRRSFVRTKGLFALLQVDAAARARLWLAISLVMFLLAVLVNIGLFNTVVLNHEPPPSGYALAQQLLSLACYGSLTFALARIGRHVRHDDAAWCAKGALFCIIILMGATAGLSLLDLQPSALQEGDDMPSVGVGPLRIGVGIVTLLAALAGLFQYVRALWLIREKALWDASQIENLRNLGLR